MTSADALIVPLADEAATIRLGEDLALALKAGDCLALTGDLGAGKSTLARAFLRAMADDPDLEVPSPTFTLVQSYDMRIPVSHFDFYRMGDPSEIDELGFDEALAQGICLVEWPEMAADELPVHRIRLTLTHEGEGRAAVIEAQAPQRGRIARMLAMRDFLAANGHGDTPRRYLTGDASVRAYEYLPLEDGRLILMDWPPMPESPPVFEGKPYPKVAHIAENAYPFVAIDQYLRENGFAAPEIVAVDYDHGFLLMDDLGQDGVLDAEGRPIAERYLDSIRCLAALHAAPCPRDIRVTADHVHTIPDFDRTAMKMEARLLIDWHLPWKRNGEAATAAERRDYEAIWDALIDRLHGAETHLLLRDFHSPNIIWRGSAPGRQKIGLIDFQDAMIGPTAYDVASLVQDARITIAPDLADALLAAYLTQRQTDKAAFDEAEFLNAYAIMAAQRNCKLAGLWVRLMQRDGKPGYMKHMPRTLAYLDATFSHPVLAPLRDWCAGVGIGPVKG